MRLGLLSLIFLGMATSSTAQKLDPIPARTVVRYPDSGGIVLGNGLTAASLDPTSRYCIAANRTSHPINANEIRFQHIVDKNTLADVLKISASGKYNGISGSSEYLRDVRIEETDTNIAVTGHFDVLEEFVTSNPDFPQIGSEQSRELTIGDLTSISEDGSLSPLPEATDALVEPINYVYDGADQSIRLTKQAKRILREGGVEAFRRECGDFFVTSVIYGGSFDGMLIARDTSEQEKTLMKGTVKGSFGIGKFSVSASRLIDTLKSSNRLELRLRSEGSGPTANPTNIDTFINFVTDFPKTVPSSARPVRLVLQSYASLRDYRQHSQESPVAIDMIVDQYLRYEHLRQTLARYLAQDSEAVFLGQISRESTRDLADSVLKESELLEQALQVCFESNQRCEYPVGLAENDYDVRAVMPLHAGQWPWAARLEELATRLSTMERQIASTPREIVIVRTRMSGGLIPRPRTTRRRVPNPAYRALEGAISRDRPCVEWLSQNLMPLYIYDRIDLWVEKPWLARSEISTDARYEMNYRTLDDLRRAAFRQEGLEYVQRPVPTGCNW